MNVGFKRQISCITPCLDKHKLEKTDKKTGCSKEKGRCRCICPRHYVHSVLCRSTKRACRNNLVAARDDRDVTHLLKKLRASLLQSTNRIVLPSESRPRPCHLGPRAERSPGHRDLSLFDTEGGRWCRHSCLLGEHSWGSSGVSWQAEKDYLLPSGANKIMLQNKYLLLLWNL